MLEDHSVRRVYQRNAACVTVKRQANGDVGKEIGTVVCEGKQRVSVFVHRFFTLTVNKEVLEFKNTFCWSREHVHCSSTNCHPTNLRKSEGQQIRATVFGTFITTKTSNWYIN